MLKELSAKDLEMFLKEHQALLIDVRSEMEFSEESIPGAINIPVDQLLGRLSEVPEDRTIITQCRTGGRSSVAALQLMQRGYKDVVNLEGGIMAWKQLNA